jgi:acyl-homoserine-lactone acylase
MTLSGGTRGALPRRSVSLLLMCGIVAGLLVTRGETVAPTVAPTLGRSPHQAFSGTIRRDTYGVPHIIADTEQDAAFAQGYATAEDHFLELARLFLRARGEQALVFGEESLREDLLMHQLGIWETANERFGDLPPYMQAVLDGYAEGYNTYLAEHRADAPDWVKPIRGVDVLAHCRAVLLIGFALDLRPLRDVKIAPKGSNMWAIGRERSASSYGLLLGNPHLEWSGPFIFHEVQITVPGKINISGATLIGFPVVTIGFNENLGWTHTANFLHADDVYELTLSSSEPMTYTYDGLSLPIKSRELQLKVKTPAGEVSKTQTILTSHLGPIFRIENGKAYAFHSPSLGVVDFLTQYNLMAKARTLHEFQETLNMQQLPALNIGYADREGNVLFVYNGRIPVRTRAPDKRGMLPGDSSDAEWHMVHPIAELPQLLNPPGGYIQNTNNAPWYTTARPLLDRTRFPPYVGDDGLPLRGTFSLQTLEATPKMTLQQMLAFMNNEEVVLATRLKPELLDLVKARPGTSPDVAEGLQVLRAWDNRDAADSRGAVLFDQWWEAYRKKASPVYTQPWIPVQPVATPTGIGDPALAVDTFERVVAEMKTRYGSVAVRWGDLHHVRRGDLELPIGGSTDTFRTVWYRGKDGKSMAMGGDSYSLAVEFTPSPTAYSLIPYSESSNPASPHFNDQLRLFAQNQFKRVWFSEADIQQHLERSYRPSRVIISDDMP